MFDLCLCIRLIAREHNSMSMHVYAERLAIKYSIIVYDFSFPIVLATREHSLYKTEVKSKEKPTIGGKTRVLVVVWEGLLGSRFRSLRN